MNESVIIAAGGTGGHISPGVALAEILVEKKEHFHVSDVYIHSLLRNQNNPDLQNAPCEVLWHNVPQFRGLSIPIYPILFLIQFIKTILTFRKRKVTAVIGMGGYSSFPAILYAILFRKKLFLCEQNCIPGKITRYFAKYAEKLALSFPIKNSLAVPVETKIIGNPIRKKVVPESLNIRQNENLHDSRKNTVNVLVLGGSQGARQLNNMILKTMENSEISQKFRFRVLTGTSLYDETVKKAKGPAEIISYANDMRPNYEWANLVVARSGAGVIAECLVFGLPMVLIPYPYAADNHQKENAEYVEKEGAAYTIQSTSEDPSPLVKYLLDWKSNPEELKTMGQNSLRLSNVNAAYQTVSYFFSH
ncbi:UDP-N-acetylglucosamine--N-acetylmuramyl-(pentapeptide) pyrophosphoryl-undecaprenol N-acetylglucosamine transferase [Leptospira ilyithenensis]|uniref:UDP-N-acetylglucosamine--N-acetylmuramyl-(pentapeptide) pyrophosphoryl-undecaprenol N-acetylglucosamine transferase n=1 Tax=Leptospira ilyithenensis TaxID=2484901 RepID=A0A4R9LL62_9LEPT|nr:UDP-N-acetylglucosamine--N-acetylmuramyl-(pentapeptide) pyrophosphoryl-undecaprenol N-acetylglucosamine transferase [Leptospira ilyithenensis]TGN08345.1 UDP-N-acetylglucosamine--N-acetylmuramyl-(pentapeptide) pyrophosphoryl-undecaprenol N-acetylglucosamine transferase [Leptospira ilyithenensis]